MSAVMNGGVEVAEGWELEEGRVVPKAMLSVAALRCLSGLEKLTVERVQRGCGGFSVDDVAWAAGLWEVGDAIEELVTAQLVRCCGWDDEDREVPCYALTLWRPVGMPEGATRYGAQGFVALVVVGVPVRRKPAMDDEMSWLWAREARLEAVRSELAAGRRWAEWELLCKRLDKVYAQSNERWRRWREGPPMSAGLCKSLVVVGAGAIGDVVDGVRAGACPVCGGVLEERDGFDADGFEITGRSCAVCVEMFVDGEEAA